MSSRSSRSLAWFGSEQTKTFRLCLGFGVLLAVVLYCLRPLYQFGDYRSGIGFADKRTLLGIENFADVVSNVGFLLVGGWGLLWCFARRVVSTNEKATSFASKDRTVHFLTGVLFAAVFLTGLGSSYFHLNPNSETLLWDRLPMVIGFSALIGLLITDRLGDRLGLQSFSVVTLVGLLTLLQWKLTGEAFSYSVLQAGTIVCVLLLPVFFSEGRLSNRSIYLAVGAYGFAKLFEVADGLIFSATHLVAGHALKHAMAALAMAFVLQGVREAYGLSEPKSLKEQI